MSTETDRLRRALLCAAETLENTLAVRGYEPGSCTDGWTLEVRREVATLAQIRLALAPRDRENRLRRMARIQWAQERAKRMQP